MILLLFAAKLAIYYNLINVDLKDITFIILSVLAMGIIFVAFSRSKLKRKKGLFLIVYSLLSLLMFADSMYYNYYNLLYTTILKNIFRMTRKETAGVLRKKLNILPLVYVLFLPYWW